MIKNLVTTFLPCSFFVDASLDVVRGVVNDRAPRLKTRKRHGQAWLPFITSGTVQREIIFF